MKKARVYIITLPITSRLDKREVRFPELELETFWL
jgi:hypothetical protein